MTQWKPTWAVVYTAQGTAEEPPEGGEDAYNEQEWQGEAQTIEYDDEYPRMPRIELDYPNVVADSITVTLKSAGTTFELTDYTSLKKKHAEKLWYKNWPVPITSKAYLHRKEGDEYNLTRIYFNPSLEGEEVDVVYDYYLTDAPICKPVIFGRDLFFNETGERHRFLKRVYDVKEKKWKFKNTYSPRVGDRELVCITAADDYDHTWAISAPSYLLVQFAKDWAGYVHEVDGKGKKIWNIVADLARAGDQYCFDRLGILYVVNRATPTPTGTFPHILKITRKDLPPYEKVTFSYANGKVERGTGKPELSLSSKYVYDKGHAEILCRKAYEFYTVRRREYVVECAGILEQIGLCEEKRFEYLGKPASGIIVGRQFSPKGTTTFTVVEKAAQGEAAGAGGGQGVGQEA